MNIVIREHCHRLSLYPFAPALRYTLIAVVTCGPQLAQGSTTDQIAESYVKLVLALGHHDADYVDYYHGPAKWKTAAKAAVQPLERIRDRATQLRRDLSTADADSALDSDRLRRQFLDKQLHALISRIDLLSGRSMSFDEESKAIYDAVAPRYPETHYAGLIEQIDLLIPGSGPLPDRYRRYREKFIVPKDKIDDVLQAAIRECRRRTLEYIDLPKSESLRVEYVSDKPWSGYNWYQGDSRSLIQINTDLPFYIDKAVAAASHEGYPGHHVYNLLVERDFYRKNHWVEFAVCPLYSPLALFMEGSAEFGVDLLFPRGDRVTFETQTLFPLAGFDPATAETYFRIRDLIGQLDFAYTEAARRFLDNELDREKTVAWLMRFHLESREEAEKSCDFFKAYGAYTITYSVGKKVLADYVRGADDEQPDPKARWKRYVDLISAPRVPSKLIQSIHEKN